MTDKVQKIKEWISKTQDGLMDAQGNFEYPEHEGAYNILCNLDAYIDSMQEECNITGIKSKHATGKLKECIDNQTKEGPEQARKQLEENPQECMYARDNYTDEDRKALCDGCEEECEFNKKERLVSPCENCEGDKLAGTCASISELGRCPLKYRKKEEPVQ